MELTLDESFFGKLYPYVVDPDITDIRWNGRALWIEHLKKGRFKTDDILDESFLKIMTQRIATLQNVNFNASESSLEASTDQLRIHAIHPFRTGEKKTILAIRKTPTVARITDESMIETKYADEKVRELLGALVRAHCSGIIIGDTGAGKTELEKYLAKFIPDNEVCITVEDTLELKLSELYPQKDIISIRVDKDYTYEMAIRDALRNDTKNLWIAEARSREIARILEGASTGCCCWTTLHTPNVWDIPDRVVQMAGKDENGSDFENDVYSFFDVGIRVRKDVTSQGVFRKIDQICFFDRTNRENHTIVFMKNGQFTHEELPLNLVNEFIRNKEIPLLKMLRDIGGVISYEER